VSPIVRRAAAACVGRCSAPAVGLHDDHRQRVRDHVVQLARDPRALAGRADRCLLIALERQQPVALVQRPELRPP
jgi:hypothetical protein